MSRRNCDLEELLEFEKTSIQNMQQLSQQGYAMQRHSDDAADLLQDQASRRAIEKTRKIGEMIHSIGNHAVEDMTGYKKKTQEELERLQRLL